MGQAKEKYLSARDEASRWRHLALELAEYLYPQELEDARDYDGDVAEDHVFGTICEVLGLDLREELGQ